MVASTVIPSVQGLKKAMTVHTGSGDFTVDPGANPRGYQDLLEQSRDERVRVQREAEDAQLAQTPMQDRNPALEQFNRTQEDAAMGPNGYNRDWASFFEAPRVLDENTPGKVRVNYNPASARLAGLSVNKVKGSL